MLTSYEFCATTHLWHDFIEDATRPFRHPVFETDVREEDNRGAVQSISALIFGAPERGEKMVNTYVRLVGSLLH